MKKERNVEEAGLRLLARRDHSREEVRRKLRARRFTGPEVEALLSTLEARNLLDDGGYARRLALALIQEKLWGPRRVLQKLLEKGISRDLAEEALKRAEEMLPTQERLRRVLQIKLKGRIPAQLISEEKKKLANFLRQRGYDWEEFVALLDEGRGWES